MIKKALKNILPANTIWYLARKKDDFNFFKIAITRKSRLLLAADMLFSKNYINEHKAHLEGAYYYKQAIRSNSVNTYFLRRNVHRIEKGMLMKPIRSVFALRFILETTLCFDALIKNKAIELSEFEWSHHVLKQYFDMVQSDHPEYLKARAVFESIEVEISHSSSKKVPFPASLNNSIPFDQLKSFFEKRKSVRWFLEKEVSNEILDKALELAASSPSSCNRSPYKYIISNTNSELTQLISSIPAGTTGWNHNIPAIAVVVGQQKAFPNIVNRHSIYVDSCLSVMPFVFGLESQGLSTCIINWADDPGREKKMKKILSLEDDEKVILSIAIGYADTKEKVAYSQRKFTSEISRYI